MSEQGEIYTAPLGTPIPTSLDGFDDLGYVDRANAFAAAHTGRPYVWPRQNGKSTISDEIGKELVRRGNKTADSFARHAGSFTVTFQAIAASMELMRTLFGDWKRAGLYTRTDRRRRNRLRRKRSARKRNRG